MTHQLTLEVPDAVYQPLLQKAQVTGQTVEAVAGACLAASVENGAPGSRLRKWAGAFASGISATWALGITNIWGKRCTTSCKVKTMLERFVDTSGWAAWAESHEQFNALAVAAFEEVLNQSGRLITTNWTLVELTALLTSPLRVTKPRQIQLLDDIQNDSAVVVVPVDAAVETAAWRLWRARSDKGWTLNDCASFVVMEERRLTEAVTADRHFEQAGFVRLLK